jgi:hypothetical protein
MGFTGSYVDVVDQSFTVPQAGLVTFTYSGRFVAGGANAAFHCAIKGTGAVSAAPMVYSSALASMSTMLPVVGSFDAAAGLNRIQFECQADSGSLTALGWKMVVSLPGA